MKLQKLSLMLAKKVKQHLKEVAGKGQVAVPDDVMERYLAECRRALEDVYSKHQSHFPRVSDLGRDGLYLWCRRKYPHLAVQHQPRMVMTFWAGKVWEAVFLAIAETAGFVTPEGFQKKVRLSFPNVPDKVPGSMDLIYDDAVWDIKTCHNDAYTQKWANASTMLTQDPYCYAEQLYAYSSGEGKDAGGWIVINKNTGDFKDVPLKPTDELADPIMIEHMVEQLQIAYQEEQPPLPEDEAELYKGEPTGNRKVPSFWANKTPYAPILWPNAIPATRGEQKIYYTEFNGFVVPGVKLLKEE